MKGEWLSARGAEVKRVWHALGSKHLEPAAVCRAPDFLPVCFSVFLFFACRCCQATCHSLVAHFDKGQRSEGVTDMARLHVIGRFGSDYQMDFS